MNTIVEVRHGAISFKETKALKDVSFSIKEGEIFGFLGPSGAGKTTTIKLLTNQLKPDPVSYTHLDVYKRQPILFAKVSMKLPQPLLQASFNKISSMELSLIRKHFIS